VIEILIGTDGAIEDARVAAAAPNVERLRELGPAKGTSAALEDDARLAAAALDAVEQWRYEPILKDGKPVVARASVTVNFALAEVRE